MSSFDASIDRSSPVPFYFQLAELIERDINAGRLRIGSQLPSEPHLGSRYGLSRTTVRQALARLEQRGLIERRKGHGTFVAPARTGMWLLQSSGGFFQEEVDRFGRSVTSRILRAERTPLPTWACEALDCPDGSRGVTLERLRSIDGAIAMYVVNHLPAWLADAALQITNPNESLYRRLRDRTGVEPFGGRRSLEAVAVEEPLAAMLELQPGAPVAMIQSSTWDRDLQTFDCYRAWLRTDRTRIDIEVLGPPTAGDAPRPPRSTTLGTVPT